MFQGVMNQSHGGGVIHSSNENRLGFSDSDGFQNPQIASVNGSDDDKKRIKLMGSNQNQVGRQIDLFGDSEPLGLSLKKTPSFLNLIEAKLSQGTKEKTTTTSKETNQISKRSRSRPTDIDSQTMSEKLKAANFTAALLRIGTWEKVAKNEGDLVGKCYYAKRKLVWEVLENGLKSKIEILWTDISAIRASFPEQQPGILEIELKNEPKFYREHNPQPRKHTLWHESFDFTGGQAKIYRRHYLQFPEGIMEKPFEKLLQYDKELLKLSQRKFPSSNSPFFQTDPYESHQKFYLDFKDGNHHQQFPSMLQFSHLAIQNPPPYPASKFNQTPGPPFVTPNDSASPMSVMDMPFIDESIGYPDIQQRSPFMETPMVNDNQPFHMAGGNQAPELPVMMASHNHMKGGNQAPELPVMMASHNQIGEFIPRFGESNEKSLGSSLHLNNSSSESVYDYLLNETDQTDQRRDIHNEQKILAKVNSMARLLEATTSEHTPVTQNTHDEAYSYRDNTNTLNEQKLLAKVNSMARLLEATTNEHTPVTQNTHNEAYSYRDNTNTNNSMKSSSTDQSGEWSNSYQDSISWIPPPGDPFMNLPRTPSFPGLLFDTPVEDFSNVNHQQWRR